MNEEQKNNILKLFEDNHIMMTNHLTYQEHYDHLLTFQDFLGTLIDPDSNRTHYNANALIYKIKDDIEEKKLDAYNEQIIRGLSALKNLNNEIAINVSGRKAEKYVKKTLRHVSRPDFKLYSNVYVSNEYGESEIDFIGLTNTGLILLEVKSVNGDVVIDNDGRLLHNGVACYDKLPIVQNMAKKKDLLFDCLNKKLEEHEIYIPLYISTRIVFCPENNMRINVDNRCRQQKWCYRSKLVEIIDNFIGTRSYTKADMEMLDLVLTELESFEKAFDYPTDYQKMKEDIAGLISMVYGKQPAEQSDGEQETVETKDRNPANKTSASPKTKASYRKPSAKPVDATVHIDEDTFGASDTTAKDTATKDTDSQDHSSTHTLAKKGLMVGGMLALGTAVAIGTAFVAKTMFKHFTKR